MNKYEDVFLMILGILIFKNINLAGWQGLYFLQKEVATVTSKGK